MFYKEIDRDIKGVIKVGQSDDENIYQELEEYVVTDELEKYLNRFLEAYLKGINGRTDKMGVWISGFFGSGKSHFLKILSYLLEDRKVQDTHGNECNASSFFLDGVKVTNDKLKAKIQEATKYSSDIDVILFNIDSKSTSDSKLNKEAIKEVFMKVFNDYLGYCGSIPFLAEFERKLDLDGDFERFKEKFEEINGSSWIEAREDFYFIQDEIIESVVSLGIMSEKEANNWAENAQNSYSVSSEKFAEYVKKYCASKGENHHVIFLVDEIGQYIADDDKLMVNLQTITEDLGTACQGKAWIVVTSQQDIDSITKTMGDNFSKIQGRFDTRIALSSANVDEVIRKRILYKTENATVILEDLYNATESILKNIVTFSEGTPEMPLYADANDFVEVYPFIPYQFKLLGNVLTSVRQYSSSGKHLADGERSMLALFKEAAQKFEEEREGILVPFNAFYSALDDFIDHTHRIVITQAARNTRLNAFDVELLKVLFMIKHVNNFGKNVENLTTLMIADINEDRLELKNKVEKSLRLLCDEGLVQKEGDEYKFLTNEEQEAENAIRSIDIDPTIVVNYVGQVAFDEVIALPNNKYKYSNRYQFSFNQKIDDKFHRNNQANGIGLHLLTVYSGQEDATALGLLAAQEKSVVVRLSDDFAYLTETEEMKRIDTFLSKPDLKTLANYDEIAHAKRKERNEKTKRIKDYIRMSLENADIYVKGRKLSIKSKDVGTRINEAFAELVSSEYSKLKDMESEPAQSDILTVLKQNKTQMTLELEGVVEPDRDALKEMFNAIQYADSKNIKFSIKQALDKFMDAPYGYIEEDVEYLIAVLYKKGKIALKMNSVIYSPASTSAEDVYKYITKREYREKVLLEVKETPKTQWVKSLKDVMRDFLGHAITTDDSDALMRDFKRVAAKKKETLEEIIKDNYGADSQLPGRNDIETAIRLIGDVSEISDPISFYRRVDELYDDFDDIAVELEDLNAFLGGTQREKFLKACNTLKIYEASKNYISDIQIIEYAEEIRKIIGLAKPYDKINKLEQYQMQLHDAIHELLEQGTKKIEPEVCEDRKIALESIPEGRPYTAYMTKKYDGKFHDLLEKLEATHDVAALYGITSESTALLENCHNEIKKEEELYQKSLSEQGMEEQGNDNPVMPEPIIKTLPVSMRTLMKNRTYTIRTEADVEAFVEELEKALKARLDENTVIKLS